MQNEFDIMALGEQVFESPLDSSVYIQEGAGVLVDATITSDSHVDTTRVMEQAGPRKRLFFDPSKTCAALVTCGGLCPGLNDVIRGLTMVLWFRYGVRDIVGLRYGYEGLSKSYGHQPIKLDPSVVEDIHQDGGTILGTSRGPQDAGKMADVLAEQGINILFTIGGDGTQRGALELSRKLGEKGLRISIVGIPKTIDNDISFTDRTFGFETAVAMSRSVITGAHMEAKGVRNGVGLVKLMGRESGFVAASSALASSDVNLVLVPEVPFRVESLCEWLTARLKTKAHAVILVAEGAGQDLVPCTGVDASGNRKLGDIGPFLKSTILECLAKAGIDVSVKYINPSYIIRSAPASADDSVFCFQLAEHAAHAAMAGRTAMVVGYWNSEFVHVPMSLAVSQRKRIDPNDLFWQSVLDNTGQPSLT